MGTLPVETAEETIARLTEERDYWRDEARRNVSVERMDRIRRLFDLSSSEAWLVATLWRARGDAVRRERLEEDMPGKDWEDRDPSSNTLQVFIHRARRKIGRDDAIMTVRGQGYRLCPRLVERIDRVIEGKPA